MVCDKLLAIPVNLSRQSKTAALNIIDSILEDKIDIIKKTDSTKECKIEDDENVIYNVFIPEADEFLLNFVYKKLVTYLQNIDNDEKIQNIFYSQVLYPQDGGSNPPFCATSEQGIALLRCLFFRNPA